MRRPISCCGALVLVSYQLVSIGGPALARKAPTPRILVLDVEPRAVPRALARRVTGVVRRTVGRNPHHRLAPRPALRLSAMLLALGCARLDPACLVRIGRQLNVDQILSGEIAQTASGYLLGLRVFDVARKKRVRSVEQELPRDAKSTLLEAAVTDVTSLALGLTLRLEVASNLEGAILLVNGQPVGTTPATVTSGLRLGTNEIVVRQRGHRDFVAKVHLRPGRPLKVQAVLRPAPPPPRLTAKPGPITKPRPTTRSAQSASKPVYKRWWFWTLIGAAVVGGGVAGALALTGGSSSPSVGVEF